MTKAAKTKTAKPNVPKSTEQWWKAHHAKGLKDFNSYLALMKKLMATNPIAAVSFKFEERGSIKTVTLEVNMNAHGKEG
jgi:hypothetical protein